MRLLQVLEALGGLGLFIFGMKTMAEGLQRFASGRFRRTLEKMAGNRLSAAMTGSCIASLLQSSGAASILIIGFVNAGLLSLYQALAMLIGTGLGTALAVQFIAFKVSFLSQPFIFFGVVLKFFCKRRRLVFLGEVLLGFGLLFFGLEVMETRCTLFVGNALVENYQNLFRHWHIVSVLAGALLTFLVQSGSAAIGIIIALTASGVIGLEYAAAMVLGEVLGTTALAGIGVIGGTLAAKRTVMIYCGIALLSITAVLLMFPWYLETVSWVTAGFASLVPVSGERFASLYTGKVSGQVAARALANGYTLFILFLTILFLPCIGFFARSAGKFLPGLKGDIDSEPCSRYIDFRVINTPSLALLQAGSELKRMAMVAHSMVSDIIQQFYEFNAKRSSQIKQKEYLLDIVQKELSSYLVELARQPLTAEISAEIPVLIEAVNNLEGIGDSCESILDSLRRKKEENVFFSDSAMDEIKSLAQKSSYLTSLAVDCLDNPETPDVSEVRVAKDELLRTVEELKTNHLARLSSGACTVLAGLLFMDIVSAFGRMGEYAFSIIETEGRLH